MEENRLPVSYVSMSHFQGRQGMKVQALNIFITCELYFGCTEIDTDISLIVLKPSYYSFLPSKLIHYERCCKVRCF